MRIALVAGTFLPHINGVISYVLDTATELSRRGHTVTVIAPAPRRGVLIDTSIYQFRIILLSSVPALIYPELRMTKPALYLLTKTFDDLSIDIVHLNDPMPICIEAMIAAKLKKLPVVLTFHTFYLDKDFLRNVRFGHMIGLIKHPLARLNANYHNYADTVICPSVSAQQELIGSGLRVPSVIIHNSILGDIVGKNFPALRRANRRRYHIDPEAHIAMFVGRLSIEKSIDKILRAWRIVLLHEPQAKLVIVGSGPEEHKLKLLTRKLKMYHAVLFTGLIPRAELLQQSIYALSDIYVSASRIENQSMSMIEAMSHGLPIVAVNKRGVSELVDNTNGILVSSDSRQLAKGILRLFQQEHLRTTLSVASLQKSTLYQSSKTIQLVEREYRQLIQK